MVRFSTYIGRILSNNNVVIAVSDTVYNRKTADICMNIGSHGCNCLLALVQRVVKTMLAAIQVVIISLSVSFCLR